MAGKHQIYAENAPPAIGPYSHAIEANGLLFISGQLGIDPQVGTLVSGGVEKEAEQALLNLGAILEKAGASFQNIVKTTVFLSDIADFAAVNAVYSKFFAHPYPARSAFQVGALPKNAHVEIEAIAALSSFNQ